MFCTLKKAALSGLLIAVVGCGQSEPETTSANSEDFLTDFLKEIDLTEKPLPEKSNATTQDASAASEQSEQPAEDIQTASTNSGPRSAFASNNSVVPASVSKSSSDTSSIAVGSTFQLLKTVNQTLVQKATNPPATASTQLRTWMTIRVDDVAAGNTLLSLRFDRVAYDQNVNGQQLSYDSEVASASVPLHLQAYASLVNNGFQFNVTDGRRVGQVLGYAEFLQQCGQQLDEQIRAQSIAAMQDSSRAVTNFVDESCGLVPNVSTTQVGDVWNSPQTIAANPPTNIQLRCRLLSVTDERVEIDMSGTYQPTVAVPNTTGVTINNCRTLGTCQFDRATGLPLQLDRSLYLTLSVTTADGQLVPQEKHIRTTIEQLPVSSADAIIPASAKSIAPDVSAARAAVAQPEYRSPLKLRNGGEPVAAPLSSTARAVYPD